MASAIPQPLKIHGGKNYLAEWIISLMRPHEHYFEGFFGGGAVLLRKNPDNVNEVVCDRNGDLTNFWRVLREPDLFYQLRLSLEFTPFSELEWQAANRILATKNLDARVRRAWAFFVRARQSMSGRQDSFAPVSVKRLRRRMNEQVSAWLTAIEGLPAVHARLMRVFIHDPSKAQRLILKYDQPGWVQYLDPPYHPETREKNSKAVYEFEMTAEEHEDLLKILQDVRHAQVLLSGYRHPLYDDMLLPKGWKRHEMAIDNKSSKKKEKETKIECVWESPT